MADIFSKEKRSQVMSKIRSSGNLSTELALANAFRAAGLKGWRRHQRLVGGRPDFLFRRKRVCVFVDGCFWHGCPRCYRAPTSNVEYWAPKIIRNRRRDRRIERALRRCGFRVFRIWECQLKQPRLAARFISRLQRALDV
ncbi:DNA mismatch endonuclease Vsr [Opitutaceae bacterium TAV1]|nr:DNA mismatch endonuclease Vsr [Opitutaceae bacterium TAV1]